MKILDLGLIDYEKTHQLQLQLVEEVLLNQTEETLILCSHPPVVTTGRKTKKEDINKHIWQGPIIETKRGGQATYHGPKQVIAYPIIDLKRRGNDIYKFLRNLEHAVSKSLESYKLKSDGDPKNTGVWIEQRKIASIGVAVKRWITYHGVAVNIHHDPFAFKGINPCGMNTVIMTNLEKELQLKNLEISQNLHKEFESIFAAHLSELLSFKNPL